MKPDTYPTGRFTTVALVADVHIFNTSSPGVTDFQEKYSTVSTPVEHSCLVPRLGEQNKTKYNPHNMGRVNNNKSDTPMQNL